MVRRRGDVAGRGDRKPPPARLYWPTSQALPHTLGHTNLARACSFMPSHRRGSAGTSLLRRGLLTVGLPWHPHGDDRGGDTAVRPRDSLASRGIAPLWCDTKCRPTKKYQMATTPPSATVKPFPAPTRGCIECGKRFPHYRDVSGAPRVRCHACHEDFCFAMGCIGRSQFVLPSESPSESPSERQTPARLRVSPEARMPIVSNMCDKCGLPLEEGSGACRPCLLKRLSAARSRVGRRVAH